MATFKCFQDITAWQKARELVKEVYAVSKRPVFFRDIGLREQIRRSSVSVMSNIAEGFERDGKREFIQFLSIAKGSCGETKSLLIVALDQRYIEDDEFNRLTGLADHIGNTLGRLMKYLLETNIPGNKYRTTGNTKRATSNND
jgi:four helix bundle protein